MDPINLLKNFPFALESKIVSRINQRFKIRRSSEPFVSGDSFRCLADSIFEPDSTLNNPLDGGIIFVHGHLIPEFWEKYGKDIKKPFILVSHNSDWTLRHLKDEWSSNPYLVKWYAQNCLVSNEKIVPVPIGIENRNHHSAGVVSDFKKLGKKRNVFKKDQIVYGFNIFPNFEERVSCLRELRNNSLCVPFPGNINNRIYRREIQKYKFVISPEGNGVDCHRTWEALLLKTLPIVKKSMLTEYFYNAGLPLLLLNDWQELHNYSLKDLNEFYAKNEPKFSSEKILFNYYKNLILKDKASIENNNTP